MERPWRNTKLYHGNGRRGIVKILFATSNPHKVEEVVAILSPHGITVESLSDLDVVPPEPVEDSDTFEGNARLKAVGYAAATGMRCLADDSGLEVDALDGDPGVALDKHIIVELKASWHDITDELCQMNAEAFRKHRGKL